MRVQIADTAHEHARTRSGAPSTRQHRNQMNRHTTTSERPTRPHAHVLAPRTVAPAVGSADRGSLPPQAPLPLPQTTTTNHSQNTRARHRPLQRHCDWPRRDWHLVAVDALALVMSVVVRRPPPVEAARRLRSARPLQRRHHSRLAERHSALAAAAVETTAETAVIAEV